MFLAFAIALAIGLSDLVFAAHSIARARNPALSRSGGHDPFIKASSDRIRETSFREAPSRDGAMDAKKPLR